jgi:hypothetical protein
LDILVDQKVVLDDDDDGVALQLPMNFELSWQEFCILVSSYDEFSDLIVGKEFKTATEYLNQ